MNTTWKRIGLMAVAASLVGALVLGGAALAQEPDDSDDDSTPRSGPMGQMWEWFDGMLHGRGGMFNFGSGDMDDMMEGRGGMFSFGGMMEGRGGMFMFSFGEGMGGHHGMFGFRGTGWSAWQQETIAEALGITTDELTEALSDGETTVADLAEANGVELQAVVDAVLAPTAEHLAVMVEYERMSQTEADQMLALMETRLTERFTTVASAQGPLAIAADALGMTTDELTEALSDGETTVADLAETAGVELQTLVDAILEPTAKHLAIAVEYGQLTQEQADVVLEKTEATITAWLNKAYLAFGGEWHFSPGKGRMPMPHFRFDFGNRGPHMNNSQSSSQFNGSAL